jgi:hypothetical protein
VLEGVVLSPDGKLRVFAEGRDSTANAEPLGHAVAERLLQQGAGRLIALP